MTLANEQIYIVYKTVAITAPIWGYARQTSRDMYK